MGNVEFKGVGPDSGQQVKSRQPDKPDKTPVQAKR